MHPLTWCYTPCTRGKPTHQKLKTIIKSEQTTETRDARLPHFKIPYHTPIATALKGLLSVFVKGSLKSTGTAFWKRIIKKESPPIFWVITRLGADIQREKQVKDIVAFLLIFRQQVTATEEREVRLLRHWTSTPQKAVAHIALDDLSSLVPKPKAC